METPKPLVFTVRRCKPQLVAPAKATPYEFKQISDIDRQSYLQINEQHVHFYEHNPLMQGIDPVKVIREALAKALVFYYPLAGRLREGPDNKLMVECTGEGVLFIEAESDMTIEQFGDPILPPFPCFEELLYDVPGSEGFLNSPLLLIQVTRLKCGGFILANRSNHAISDGTGAIQFFSALSELARGADVPSILPVWERDILNARDPPRVTCTHNEYVDDDDDAKDNIRQFDGMAHRSFFISPKELSNLCTMIPSHLRPHTTFEVLSACVWRCYTIASRSNPKEKASLQFPVNARQKFNPPIPKGYYGNVLALPVAMTTVGELCQNPLGYALELIRNTKAVVTEEYMRSLADLMVIKSQPKGLELCLGLADIRRIGFDHVDYGWGKPLYNGPPKAWEFDNIPGARGFYMPFNNRKGEHGTVLVISLFASVMERFTTLMEEMLKHDPQGSPP